MRIGVFGGSFDPVHYGHLLLAECCREERQLDQVWFVPTAVSPNKQHRYPAPTTARIDMLDLAVGGYDVLRVSRLEIERGGISYTVDTLTTISRQQPDNQLFLLMGADSLADLPFWRSPERICQLALPVVVTRHGSPEPDFEPLAHLVAPARLAEIRRSRVWMPGIELSSSDIRQRAATGRSIRYRTPRAVEKFIQTHQLYRAG